MDNGSSVSTSKRIKDDNGVENGNGNKILHWYRQPILDENGCNNLLNKINGNNGVIISNIITEYCYNIGLNGSLFSDNDSNVLKWLLCETFQQNMFSTQLSFLNNHNIPNNNNGFIVEVGPRLSFTTAWSSNAVSICQLVYVFF